MFACTPSQGLKHEWPCDTVVHPESTAEHVFVLDSMFSAWQDSVRDTLQRTHELRWLNTLQEHAQHCMCSHCCAWHPGNVVCVHACHCAYARMHLLTVEGGLTGMTQVTCLHQLSEFAWMGPHTCAAWPNKKPTSRCDCKARKRMFLHASLCQ